MAYTKLGDFTWSASSPKITGTIYYDYQRAGADMQYKIKTVLDPLPYSDSRYGFNIYETIKLDSVAKVSAHAIKGNTSYASSGYTYETGWLTVSGKSSGTTALSVNIYTTSDPDKIDKTYNYSTLYVVPAASTMTVPAITLGSAATLKITPAVSGYKHTIKYKFGSTSGTIVSRTSDTSISWTPAIDLASQIPNAASGTGTLTLETYSDSTKIGSRDYTFTAAVPTSVKPTVSSVVLSDEAGYLATFGAYVQGKSRLKLNATATQAYGSPIKSYTFIVDGKSTAQTSAALTVDLMNGGDISVIVRVTDGRGRVSADYSTTITVIPYAAPQITAMTAGRCKSNGEPDPTGTYVNVVFSGAISPLNNINNAAWKVGHKKPTEEFWTDTAVTVPQKYAPINASAIIPNIAANSPYIFRISATDTVTGEVTSVEIPIPAGYAFFRTNAELNGLSFGKEEVKEETLSVAWDAYFDKNVQVDGDVSGTWLRSTAHSDLGATPGSYPVFSDGWLYSRTLAEMRADLAAYETVSLTVVSDRLTDLSYTARYYPMLGMCFVRIYGKINADMNTGYDYNLLNIGDHAPQYGAALAVKCGKDVMAIAQSNGVISLRPMGENIAASAGWVVYIAGFWFA